MVNREYLGLSPLNGSKKLKLKSVAWTLTWVFHCCVEVVYWTIIEFFFSGFNGFRIVTSIITFILYRESWKHFDQEIKNLENGLLKKNAQLELSFCMFGCMSVLETFLNCTYFAQGSRSPMEVTFQKWSIHSI